MHHSLRLLTKCNTCRPTVIRLPFVKCTYIVLLNIRRIKVRVSAKGTNDSPNYAPVLRRNFSFSSCNFWFSSISIFTSSSSWSIRSFFRSRADCAATLFFNFLEKGVMQTMILIKRHYTKFTPWRVDWLLNTYVLSIIMIHGVKRKELTGTIDSKEIASGSHMLR